MLKLRQVRPGDVQMGRLYLVRACSTIFTSWASPGVDGNIQFALPGQVDEPISVGETIEVYELEGES